MCSEDRKVKKIHFLLKQTYVDQRETKTSKGKKKIKSQTPSPPRRIQCQYSVMFVDVKRFMWHKKLSASCSERKWII